MSAPVAPGTGNPLELDAAGSCVEGAASTPAEAEPVAAADPLEELTAPDELGPAGRLDDPPEAEALVVGDDVEAAWGDA